MNSLTQLAFILAPAIIGWYRKRQGKLVTLPIPLLVLMCILIVGWPLALACAFGYNPVAWVVRWLEAVS